VDAGDAGVVDVGEHLGLAHLRVGGLGGEVLQDLGADRVVVDAREHQPLQVVGVDPHVDLVLQGGGLGGPGGQEDVADRRLHRRGGSTRLQRVDHRRLRRDAELGATVPGEQIDQGAAVVGSDEPVVDRGQDGVGALRGQYRVELGRRGLTEQIEQGSLLPAVGVAVEK
jgi:hypothetical protein